MPPRKPIRPTRPQGHPTRGKTATNRLRRVDNFLLLTAAALLRQRGRALVVDVGYGETPVTTLESAARFRALNPTLPILGVEIDPIRVETALPFADNLTDFRRGGFNLPLEDGETVRLIRAMNVLRQYDESEVLNAWQTLGHALIDGGLLIEGTSDPFGRIAVLNVLRRQAESLHYAGVVFSTNFKWGFSPAIFQPVLPKNFIHRMTEGEPIYQFMEDWKQAAHTTISHKSWGLRQWFVASAYVLAERGYSLHLHDRLLRRGYLYWQINRLLPNT